MPTVLPGDNQLKGFQCRHVWRGPEHTRQEESRFSGSQGPPQASGCMTVLSLKHHDSKRWDKSLCSVHAVPLDSSRGGDEGLIKILQINYTKKKRQIIYIPNLYKAFTSPSSFVQTLQGEKERWLIMRRGRLGRGSGERAHLHS